MLARVKPALTGAGIDIPYPTMQVLLHDQTEAADGDRTRQREGWPAGDSPPEPRHLNEVRIERSAPEKPPAPEGDANRTAMGKLGPRPAPACTEEG